MGYNDRLLEERTNTQGLSMRIISYKNSHDIDVEFQDGYIARHKQYSHFKRGNIRNPNHKFATNHNKVGQKVMNNEGFEVECVQYTNYDDIIAQIIVNLNGIEYKISKQCSFYNFKRGLISFDIIIDDIIYKKCTQCGRILAVNNFHNSKTKGKWGKVSICKKCASERVKEYRSKNPNKVINQSNKRRNKMIGKGITKEQWLEMMNFFGWRCAYSGEYMSFNKCRTVDHIIPINKGGTNEIWNLVPMHRSYNCSKQDFDPSEWYIEQSFYSEERLQKICDWQIYAYNKYSDEHDLPLKLII